MKIFPMCSHFICLKHSFHKLSHTSSTLEIMRISLQDYETSIKYKVWPRGSVVPKGAKTVLIGESNPYLLI